MNLHFVYIHCATILFEMNLMGSCCSFSLHLSSHLPHSSINLLKTAHPSYNLKLLTTRGMRHTYWLNSECQKVLQASSHFILTARRKVNTPDTCTNCNN